jgi:putative DNA primase/helicase
MVGAEMIQGMGYREFLTHLFQDKPDDSKIGIFELPSARASNLADCNSAANFVDSINPHNNNVYFACGILDGKLNSSSRGSEADVIGIPGFWADLDFGDHHNEKKYPPDLESVLNILKDFDLPPSIIIHTGHGLHVYWLFKEPWIFDNDDEKWRAKKLCTRLQDTLRSIASRKGGYTFDTTSDLARILRLPKTFNNKKCNDVLEIYVYQENEFRYNPEDFDDVCIEENAIKPEEPPLDDRKTEIEKQIIVDPWAEPPKDKFEALLIEVPRFRLSWDGDRTGTETWKGTSPSEFAMSIASIAASYGWSKQEVADLIIAFYRKHHSSGVFNQPVSMAKALRPDYLAATIARAFQKNNPKPNRILDALSRNEDGDADLFIEEFRGKFAFDHSNGRWYVFREHFWEEDILEESLRAIESVIKLYRDESLQQNPNTNDQGDKKLSRMLKERAFQLGGHDRKRRVLKLAASGKPGLGLTGEEWDRHPYLLPCVNGVVKLMDDSLESGKPEQYLKTFCPTAYDPTAGEPRYFIQALNDMFDGDQETIHFLQRLFGLALIGEYREPVFPIFLGRNGQNGKATLVEVFADILGPLAGTVSPELLLKHKHPKPRGAAAPELMVLKGRRLVYASETNNGRSFDTSQVKMLAGGDRIPARDPYGKRQIEFYPSHTLFLITNFLPSAPENESAYWLRPIIIEFRYSYVENPDKKNSLQRQAIRRFKDELLKEGPSILKWAVDGCRDYLQGGLKCPDSTRVATDNYHDEMDTFKFFSEDCLEESPGNKLNPTDALEAYSKFCGRNQLTPLSRISFSEKMKNKYSYNRTANNRFYEGVKLRSSPERVTVMTPCDNTDQMPVMEKSQLN